MNSDLMARRTLYHVSHKAMVVAAVAERSRGGEIRQIGAIPNRADQIRKLVEKLGEPQARALAGAAARPRE